MNSKLSGLKSLKFKPVMIAVYFVAGAAILTAGIFFYSITVPKDKNDKTILYKVKAEEDVGAVARGLQEQGIISSVFVFETYGRLGPAGGKLVPGTYRLSSSLNVRTISRMMATGQVATVRLTIPEGYTTAKIAKLWQSQGLGASEDFIAATKETYSHDFLRQNNVQGNLEGYLFPATYNVKLESAPRELIIQMLDAFGKSAWPLVNQPNTVSLTPAEVVNLASIVELEGKTQADRKVIAGVFQNRLARKMKLESDVTINYVTGKSATAASDLRIDSVYNSYLYKGLPPTPVSNPGKESILAVLEPTKSDYLFFIAARDGKVYFAKNLAEHEQNIKTYLQ